MPIIKSKRSYIIGQYGAIFLVRRKGETITFVNFVSSPFEFSTKSRLPACSCYFLAFERKQKTEKVGMDAYERKNIYCLLCLPLSPPKFLCRASVQSCVHSQDPGAYTHLLYLMYLHPYLQLRLSKISSFIEFVTSATLRYATFIQSMLMTTCFIVSMTIKNWYINKCCR